MIGASIDYVLGPTNRPKTPLAEQVERYCKMGIMMPLMENHVFPPNRSGVDINYIAMHRDEAHRRIGPYFDVPYVGMDKDQGRPWSKDNRGGPASIEARELLGDPVMNSMTLRAIPGKGALTGRDIETWIYDNITGIGDRWIPGTDDREFDHKVCDLADRHPKLWLTRATDIDSRRALWAMWRCREAGMHGSKEARQQYRLMNDMPDEFASRYAKLLEARWPRWQRGEIDGIVPDGAQAAREAEAIAMRLLPKALRRDTAYAREDVLMRRDVREMDAAIQDKATSNDELLERRVKLEDDEYESDGDREYDRYYADKLQKRIDADHKEALERGSEALWHAADWQHAYDGIAEALEREADKATPEVARELREKWVADIESRKSAFYDAVPHVGLALEGIGEGATAYRILHMSIPEERHAKYQAIIEDEDQKAFEEHMKPFYDRVDKAQKAYDDAVRQKLADDDRRAKQRVQDAIDQYDHDRAVRAAVGRPLPGDEYSGEEWAHYYDPDYEP